MPTPFATALGGGLQFPLSSAYAAGVSTSFALGVNTALGPAGAAILAQIARQSAPAVSAGNPVAFIVIPRANYSASGALQSLANAVEYTATSLSGNALGGLSLINPGTDRDFAAGDFVSFSVLAKHLNDLAGAATTLSSGKLATNGDGSGLTNLSKAQVGLSNVDNTSDANKPVSTATATALAGKLGTTGDGSGLTGFTATQMPNFDASGYGYPRPFSWALGSSAAVTAGTDLTAWQVVARAGKPAKVFLAAKTAPVGAALIVDILRSSDGGVTFTSLWAVTPANRPRIAAGATTGTATAFDTTALAEGDLLRIDVAQVGSTTAGQGVTVSLLALTKNN